MELTKEHKTTIRKAINKYISKDNERVVRKVHSRLSENKIKNLARAHLKHLMRHAGAYQIIHHYEKSEKKIDADLKSLDRVVKSYVDNYRYTGVRGPRVLQIGGELFAIMVEVKFDKEAFKKEVIERYEITAKEFNECGENYMDLAHKIA